MWRLAESLKRLRTQIDEAYPHRSIASDGTIGDESHKATNSDHNAFVVVNGIGVVRAFDITEDWQNGPNLPRLAVVLINDPRTRYVIYERRIFNVEKGDTNWRPYSGLNAHEKHLHVSVSLHRSLFDKATEWSIEGREEEVLEKGDSGKYVRKAQQWLSTCGMSLEIDGDYGAGTELAVKVFQKLTWLPVTGIYDGLVTAPQLAARVEAIRNGVRSEFSRAEINGAKSAVT